MRSLPHVTRAARIALALLLTVMFGWACHTASEPEQRYALRGKVVSVDVEGQRVTLAHDEIAGYMPAMTMPFRVKDEWVMSALKPGYSVTADLVVAGSKSWIENLVVTTPAGPPSQPSKVEGATEPTPGEPAPPFSLVNQDGRAVTLESLRGKAVALTFIYTRCPLPDYCPLMSDNFAAVELALRANPAVYEKSHLLSITIDPAYDTPAVMKAYAKSYVPDARALAHWDFATGAPDEIRRVALSYGLVYETQNDQIVHSLRTAVVAPDGRLVKVFRGNDWKPEEVAAAIEAAAGE